MAAALTILGLISEQNHATVAFLTATAEQWADAQMLLRYRIPTGPTDPADHFAKRCWEKLKEEYRVLRTWFLEDGSFSPLLHSRFMSTLNSGPIGDGIGWDYGKGGEIDQGMLRFKCAVLAATRAAEAIRPEDRDAVGTPLLGSAMRMIRSAYYERAAMHRWRPFMQGGKQLFSGTEMSDRWVAFRTYSFLLRFGAEHAWAWETSKAKAVFGPTDEEQSPFDR